MIVQEESNRSCTYVVFLNATRERCMEEFNEYEERYPTTGYGTRIDQEGVDQGFLGDGYYIVAKRMNSC
jgi:hypothetical protein